jgi:RHS repeat-associated protein
MYAEGLMPVAEFGGSGSVAKAFIYAGGPVPVAFVAGGSIYHIVADHLGSPRLVVNAGGTVVKRIDYDSFGNVIADNNPGLFLCFGFAGGMADPDHALIRFGARDYQPSTGRWAAKDPILFGGGLNLYGYVGGDPVNWVDPDGKDLVFADIVVYADAFIHNLFHPDSPVKIVPKSYIEQVINAQECQKFQPDYVTDANLPGPPPEINPEGSDEIVIDGVSLEDIDIPEDLNYVFEVTGSQ